MKKLLAAGLLLLANAFLAQAVACTPDAQTLCLDEGRFEVQIDWSDVAGNPKTLGNTNQSGSGAAHMQTDDTGLFSLFDDQHYEVVVKALDGCPVNDRFWLFTAATTNVEYTIRVTDTDANVLQEYTNPQGTDAPVVADTNAFDTCAVATTTSSAPLSAPPAIEFEPTEAGTCISSPTTLCLFSNRFAVSVDWVSNMNSGDGMGIPITNESGLFWFFNSNNVELIFNVYDGRPVNGNFWFFSSGLTNVEYHLTVEDTITGRTKTYSNPEANTLAPTILDTSGFAPDSNPAQPIPALSGLALVLLSLIVGLVALPRLRP